MTATIIRTLCDGEELVSTESHDLSSQVEGDPRGVSFRNRRAAISDARPSGVFAAGMVPSAVPSREAR